MFLCIASTTFGKELSVALNEHFLFSFRDPEVKKALEVKL